MTTNLKNIFARYKLKLATCNELQRAAVKLLDQGRFSDALVELAGVDVLTTEECRVLFEKAVTELGVELPSDDEAIWEVLKEYIKNIAESIVSPREGMRRIVEEIVHPAHLHQKTTKYLGDSHDIEKLLGGYYAYDDLKERPMETSYKGKHGEEAIKAYDQRMINLAQEWIKKHREK